MSLRSRLAVFFSKRSKWNETGYGGTQALQPPIEAKQEPFQPVDTKELRPDDIVIAVMGPTGSGKSTFISSASGRNDSGIGHTLKSFTDRVTTIRLGDKINGRHVVLVDTPGFDDTFQSDLYILDMVSNWLVSSYNNNKLLSGILYLHRITDNRMAGTPLKNLRVFRKLCGKDALDSVYLTTTMWDEVEPEVGKKRLEQLRTEYWKTMIEQGAQIACCRSDDDSAKRLIRDIIHHEKPNGNDIVSQLTASHPPALDAEEQPMENEELARTKSVLELPSTNDLDADNVMGRTGPARNTGEQMAGADPGSQPDEKRSDHYGDAKRLAGQTFDCEKSEGTHFTTGEMSIQTPAEVSQNIEPTGTATGSEMAEEGYGADDIIIAVVGPSGSGKSVFIRRATGLVLHTRFWDPESERHVVLVDAPSIGDTPKSGLDALNSVSDWLGSSYSKEKSVSGILYLQPMTDSSMAGSPPKDNDFKILCGKDALDEVYLMTNMRDEAVPSGEETPDQLKKEYWQSMIDRGAQLAPLRYDDDAGKSIIQKIIDHEKIDPAQGGMQTQKISTEARHLQVDKEPTQTNSATGITTKTLGTKASRADDIIIIVMSQSGSRNSRFIRSVTGLGVLPMRFRDQASGQFVVLVDTPGFGDTFKSEMDVLDMVSKWLVSSYSKQTFLSGILYLHRITDDRMAGTHREHVTMFRKLCGSKALDRVYLATTMWDDVDPKVGEERLDKLKKEYWKRMINHGAQVARSGKDNESPKQLIQQIIARESPLKVLLIQEEMAKFNKELKETAAGQQLYSDLEQLVEKRTYLLQRISKEKKAATDAVILKELQGEYDDLRAQIDENFRQMQELKLSWRKRFKLAWRQD